MTRLSPGWSREGVSADMILLAKDIQEMNFFYLIHSFSAAFSDEKLTPSLPIFVFQGDATFCLVSCFFPSSSNFRQVFSSLLISAKAACMRKLRQNFVFSSFPSFLPLPSLCTAPSDEFTFTRRWKEYMGGGGSLLFLKSGTRCRRHPPPPSPPCTQAWCTQHCTCMKVKVIMSTQACPRNVCNVSVVAMTLLVTLSAYGIRYITFIILVTCRLGVCVFLYRGAQK